jgi:hypothetical protein
MMDAKTSVTVRLESAIVMHGINGVYPRIHHTGVKPPAVAS